MSVCKTDALTSMWMPVESWLLSPRFTNTHRKRLLVRCRARLLTAGKRPAPAPVAPSRPTRRLRTGSQTTLAYSANAAGTAGTLTVTDDRHVAAIALLGNYMAGSFVAAADGIGGTLSRR
jgi:hypothetical protein